MTRLVRHPIAGLCLEYRRGNHLYWRPLFDLLSPSR